MTVHSELSIVCTHTPTAWTLHILLLCLIGQNSTGCDFLNVYNLTSHKILPKSFVVQLASCCVTGLYARHCIESLCLKCIKTLALKLLIC